MNNSDEVKRTEQEELDKKQYIPNGVWSRRELLASIGLAGTAAVAGAFLTGDLGLAQTNNVTGSVYSPGDPNECGCVLRTTLAELRAITSPVEGCVYYVTDRGQEGTFYYDASDTVTLDNTGTVVVSGTGKRFKRFFEGTVNVKWFGAKGDGVSDDTIHIQAALEALANQPTQGASPYGTLKLHIPRGVYIVSSPIYIANQGTVICGDGKGISVLKCGSSFAADNRSKQLGKWVFIGEPGYFFSNQPRAAMYNIGISDLTIDFGHLLDVKGILYRGARNSSYIRNIQFSKFANTCVSLGKSDVDQHAITQGVWVENCYAIGDGNAGSGAQPIDYPLFEVTAGNENVFINCMAAPGRTNGIGSGIRIGNGNYVCGGNKLIACSFTNFRGISITVSSVEGFQVGETLTNAIGFKAKINSIDGNILKCTVLDLSNYIVEIGQNVSGAASGASSQVISYQAGCCIFLDSSWNTTVDCNTCLENSAIGILLHSASLNDANACRENFIDHARSFQQTVSCAVLLRKSGFNKINMPTYASFMYVAAECIMSSIFFLSGTDTTLPLLINRSTTVHAIGITDVGMKLLGNKSGDARVSFENCKIQGDAFGGDMRTSKRWIIRDRNAKTRLHIEDAQEPSITLCDGSANPKISVTHNGKVLLNNLPNSDPGVSGQIWSDGTNVKISGALETRKMGSTTQSADGITLQFKLLHGLGATPTAVHVTPNSAEAAGFLYAIADPNEITIVYSTAPTAGMNNMKWTWTVF